MNKTQRVILCFFIVLAIACGGMVPGPPVTVRITTSQLPAGTMGIEYSATLEAEGGMPPYNWTIISSAELPPGLELSEEGVISGTPMTPGTYDFVVRATDQNLYGGSKALSIIISDP